MLFRFVMNGRSVVRRAATRCGGLILLAVVMVGCGGDGRPGTIPVTITVTHKGQPAVGALVVMHPTNPDREKQIGGKPFGKVQEDGSVKITTYEMGDGAPEGDYGITVQWAAESKGPKLALSEEGSSAGRDRLNGKFADPRMPVFKMTVKAGGDNKMELKLD